MNNVVPFRPRSEVPPSSVPTTRTPIPRHLCDGPHPITVEGDVQFMQLWTALRRGGFDLLYDQRTTCFLIRKRKPPGSSDQQS